MPHGIQTACSHSSKFRCTRPEVPRQRLPSPRQRKSPKMPFAIPGGGL
jgi:hypothetical protein